jgi:hypothetical protein
MHARTAGRRASGLRALLFSLECGLGAIRRGAGGGLTHWSRWLLPVAVLLYLLIVVATALLSGFWQAVIVSLSAVGVQAYLSTRQSGTSIWPLTRSTPVTLVVFVLVALTVSRLSAGVTSHAREAESRGGQMHDLYEFTRRTLQMNLHVEPGRSWPSWCTRSSPWKRWRLRCRPARRLPGRLLERGPAGDGAERLLLRNLGRRSGTGLGRRVVRLGTVPVGSLMVRGDTTPLVNNAIASLIAITFDRYRAFANESRIETERRTEQLARHRARQPGPRLQDAAHRHPRRLAPGLGEMGHSPPARPNWWR